MSESYIKFDVRRASSGDIHGQYTGCVWRNGQPALWLTCEFGRLAKDTFPEALELAQFHGIPNIPINDGELFAALGIGTARASS